MIGRLRGALVHTDGSIGVIDVQGVGYEVAATHRALAEWAEGGEVEVHVHTAVREDAIALYGFVRREERALFRQLIAVSGVGPKLALAALDALGVEGLARAVSTDDVRTLSKIPGVGKKTAQRLALELKGKLPEVAGAPQVVTAVAPTATDPLVLALERLGYSRSEIAAAQNGLEARGFTADTPVSDRLKAALALLYRS